MQKQKIEIPVVLIIFNRPYLVEKQMERLSKIKPEHLFVISDAARKEIDGEYDLVEQSRKIVESIDWPCCLEKIYAQKNMGCDARIVSGLNEVFSKVDKAIILEDDCLPNESFFAFCQELLLKYEDTSEIMYISGTKFAPHYPIKESYGFSYSTGTWGWATWKRAWDEWHWNIEEWEAEKNNWLKGIYSNKYRKSWIRDMELYFPSGKIPWDYVWKFCVGKRLSIFPSVNLIENLGFGEDATHTNDEMYGYENQIYEIEEMIHPDKVVADLGYPKAIEKQFKIPLIYRVKRKIKKVFLGKNEKKGKI